MKVVEMFYTVQETALLLRLCEKTVIAKLKKRDFGDEVVNLGGLLRPDYRIPASGINRYLAVCRVFPDYGIAARSEGELRRKTGKFTATKFLAERPPNSVCAAH